MRFIIKDVSDHEIMLEVHGTLMGMESTESFEDQLKKLEDSEKKIIILSLLNLSVLLVLKKNILIKMRTKNLLLNN